jgi:hypothetical protein
MPGERRGTKFGRPGARRRRSAPFGRIAECSGRPSLALNQRVSSEDTFGQIDTFWKKATTDHLVLNWNGIESFGFHVRPRLRRTIGGILTLRP